MNITNNDDTNGLILSHLTPLDLVHACQSNKYLYRLCHKTPSLVKKLNTFALATKLVHEDMLIDNYNDPIDIILPHYKQMIHLNPQWLPEEIMDDINDYQSDYELVFFTMDLTCFITHNEENGGCAHEVCQMDFINIIASYIVHFPNDKIQIY